MRRELTTAIPPEEIEAIVKEKGLKVKLKFEDAEPFHGMPRYRVVIEGDKEEVDRFVRRLMLARAGG
jgi:uncharacterized repeat protein (TIGR04140 family)